MKIYCSKELSGIFDEFSQCFEFFGKIGVSKHLWNVQSEEVSLFQRNNEEVLYEL